MSIVIKQYGYDVWAKIQENSDNLLSIKWVKIDNATVFSTQEQAKKQYDKAISDSILLAQQKADKINKKGGKRFLAHQINYNFVRDYETQLLKDSKKINKFLTDNKDVILQNNLSDKSIDMQIYCLLYNCHNTVIQVTATKNDYLPAWLSEQANYSYSNYSKDSIVFETVIQNEELLKPIELFFVRNQTGWLGLDRKKLWTSVNEIHQATPFYSLEAAKSAIQTAQNNYVNQKFAIVKSSMLITNVISNQKDNSLPDDQLTNTLAAGCEAKEIASQIQSISQNRIDCLNQKTKPKNSI